MALVDNIDNKLIRSAEKRGSESRRVTYFKIRNNQIPTNIFFISIRSFWHDHCSNNTKKGLFLLGGIDFSLYHEKKMHHNSSVQ
jgi:hypothetical protein